MCNKLLEMVLPNHYQQKETAFTFEKIKKMFYSENHNYQSDKMHAGEEAPKQKVFRLDLV